MGVVHARMYIVLPGGWPRTVKVAVTYAICVSETKLDTKT